MISFDLSNEQKILKQKFHRIAESQLRPLVLSVDQEAPGPIDLHFFKIMVQENLNALIIPKEYGGKGLDCVTLAILIEEISWGSVDFSSIYQANLHAIKTLLIAGSQKQKAEFLTMMMDPKEGIASFCPTEPTGGLDSSSFSMTARLEKGSYVLNGVKNPVINAGDSRFYVVWANMSNDRGRSGINAFIVPGKSPGISYGRYYDKSGYRGVPVRMVTFKNVKVPKNNLIGPLGSGYLTLMQTAIGAGLLLERRVWGLPARQLRLPWNTRKNESLRAGR